MPNFYDLSIKNPEKLQTKGNELGWNEETYQIERNYLDGEDLSKVKKKARQEKSSLQIYLGNTKKKLLRDVSKLQSIDIIQNPGLEINEKGVDKVIAENAAKNNILIAFTFEVLLGESEKKRTRRISDIREGIRICEKYDAKYVLTTGAKEKTQLRSPRNLRRFINSINGDGRKALQLWPEAKIKEVRG